MNASKSLGLAISVFFALGVAASAQGAADDQTKSRQVTTPKPQAFLKSLVGTWEGTCRSWFRPANLLTSQR